MLRAENRITFPSAYHHFSNLSSLLRFREARYQKGSYLVFVADNLNRAYAKSQYSRHLSGSFTAKMAALHKACVISFPFDWELYHVKCCRGGFAEIFDKYRQILSTRPAHTIPMPPDLI